MGVHDLINKSWFEDEYGLFFIPVKFQKYQI